MAHDFAKKTREPVPTLPISPGKWLFALLAVGVFATFIYYLWQIKPEADQFAKELEQQTAPKTHSKPLFVPPESSESEDKQLTFYRLLPELEYVSKNVENVLSKEESFVSREQAELNDNKQYLIQTDSLRSGQDADRRRAQLILLGFDAKVEKVSLSSGLWYRVTVGPYETKKEVHKAQNILARNQIIGSIRTITN